MNERDGEGKEYYENGNIKFEVEYSNGKKNGKIKEYDKNGKLLFEGEYINDYRVDDTIFSYGDKFESEEIYEIEFSTLLSTKNLISNNDFEVINFEQF